MKTGAPAKAVTMPTWISPGRAITRPTTSEARSRGRADDHEGRQQPAVVGAGDRAGQVGNYQAVAHRLSQAATADSVVVMDDGRVIERGRPDELRPAGGVYARLRAAWSRGTE